MTRPTKDEYYLSIADQVATRSTCGRRSVGCVLVDADNHIVSTGYNGPPRSFPHCTTTPCLGAGKHGSGTPDLDGCLAVHAETNAFLQLAGRTYKSPLTLYTQVNPCFACAKNVCNSDVKRVVVKDWYHADHSLRVSDLFTIARIELIVKNV